MCPPMSCRLHMLSSEVSSDETTNPLFQSRYLIAVDDELASDVCKFLWITGLDHFVQTRKEKHSAMLKITKFHKLRKAKNTSLKKGLPIRKKIPKIYEQIPPA